MAKIGQRPDGNKEERMGPLIMGLSLERDIGNRRGKRKEENGVLLCAESRFALLFHHIKREKGKPLFRE